MRYSSMIGAVLAAVSAGVVACSSGHPPADERSWFRSYARQVTQDMRGPSEYGLVPAGGPYVGSCADHRAAVSWQAALAAQPGKNYENTIQGRGDWMNNALDRALVDSGLPAKDVSIIQARSRADPRETDTLILKPSGGSRVQVSVPDPTVILAVGYVSC
jgi:hypothetical protein